MVAPPSKSAIANSLACHPGRRPPALDVCHAIETVFARPLGRLPVLGDRGPGFDPAPLSRGRSGPGPARLSRLRQEAGRRRPGPAAAVHGGADLARRRRGGSPGLRWQVVNAWGDPIMPGGPVRAGREPVGPGTGPAGGHAPRRHGVLSACRAARAPDHGLMAINFEYTDDNLLHPDGMADLDGREGAEVEERPRHRHRRGRASTSGSWRMVKDSPYGRRITADTPVSACAGPRPGTRWCAPRPTRTDAPSAAPSTTAPAGQTPWGTYLSCEENVTPYFVNDSGRSPGCRTATASPPRKDSWGYRWHEFDERFDAARHPNEPNRHRLGGGDRSVRPQPRRRSSAPPWGAWRTRAPR